MKTPISFSVAAVAILHTSTLTSALPATGPQKRELEQRHAELLESRQGPALLIVPIVAAMYAVIQGTEAASVIIGDFANALVAAFDPSGSGSPWSDSDNCLISVHTQGGVSSPTSTWL